ncbi:hypothetical protein TanjilG_07219 [Lupinus angustifolius]|uniref:Uncharacterized protein n=2 Tax=Lupinus angustifolius TaxID=3871 RepID=A0A1J7GZ96_LUPAN|nr:hypothetical protein TanjilG_07219 [Lupinus angustifolius]
MGNCLRNNKISAQDHENYGTHVESCDVAKVQKVNASSSSKLKESVQKEQGMKKKKKVRFNIQNDDGEENGDGGSEKNSRSGVVRIKVVMTQKEFKRVLSCQNDEHNTSLEQLLSAFKFRGGVSKICEYNNVGTSSWRPALESIPENRLIFNNPSM